MPSLPGFRDFYPEECAFRNAIFHQWRAVVQRYGFIEYDGPPLEPLDLFTKKSGTEIVGQLYNFIDKGDRAVALRPEMTPTLARLVTARQRDFKKPLKWFAVPQVFRYERQQRGRLREHYQLNCDLIGEPGLEADAELIALAIDVLRAFGLTEKDFVVRLSDRQFWTDFLDESAVPEEKRYAFIQAIDKSEREGPEKTGARLAELELTALLAPVQAILTGQSTRPSARLETVEAGLQARGLCPYVQRDYTIVRGLAYYTGVVWEIFDRAGEFRAIAGGGRYDSLLNQLGGVDLPALGFGMGDVVLGEILKSRAWTPPRIQPSGLYVVIADETYRPQALALVQRLRDTFPVAIEFPFVPTKLGKQFQTAEERQAGLAVVVDAAILQDEVQLKILSTREQRRIEIKELFSLLHHNSLNI